MGNRRKRGSNGFLCFPSLRTLYLTLLLLIGLAWLQFSIKFRDKTVEDLRKRGASVEKTDAEPVPAALPVAGNSGTQKESEVEQDKDDTVSDDATVDDFDVPKQHAIEPVAEAPEASDDTTTKKPVAAKPKKWYFCAAEWQQCNCPGTMRWGGKETWLEVQPKAMSRGVDMKCSIKELKDVLPGEAKHCECSRPPKGVKGDDVVEITKEQTADDVRRHLANNEAFWMFCAPQWQSCICEGPVRWGNIARWKTIRPNSTHPELTVNCSIKALPDIAPGDDGKHCECLVKPNTPYFDRINPGIRQISGAGVAEDNLVGSCDVFEAAATSGLPCDEELWSAVEGICSPSWKPQASEAAGDKAMNLEDRRGTMNLWVDPRFRGNYDRLYNSSGWVQRAFVNYYAGHEDGKHARMTEELIRSVHLFSDEVVVVVHFGFATPDRWSPKEFPRLVLFNAAPLPMSAKRSFNFNKLRAMVMTRIVVGIQLDSDQFVAPGVDHMFKATAREVTKEYPFPILPTHFLDWGPTDQGPGGIGAKLWDRYCPSMKAGSCEFQTQRWGHAHPTWSFWATPFLGRWLRRNFRDETLPADGKMKPLQVIEVKEDEDLLNVATWEDKGTKQWCKFDIPDPVEFDTILNEQSTDSSGSTKCIKGMCGNIGADGRYHKHGVVKVFYTAHHAINPSVTRTYLDSLNKRRHQLNGPYLYNHRFYKTPEELKAANPKLACMV